MDFIVGFLFLLASSLLILFFIYQPEHNDKRAIGIYNTTMIGLNTFLSTIFFFWMKSTYKGTIDDAWWFFMAICGSFILFTFIILVSFILRNFWLFKESAQNYYKRW